ncbi:putative diguanylate cyclase YcdT [Microbulbifer aggregans]|uniref:diguanylate cyclase n=1 Tax=Microbulbifer aggregans TaxID=1769779 RepID=A0A1C9WC79_9GAMM|nr:GGDEF domain-containing protein [Microbulbifer aggregans]AOS98755.1 putative diguanylate cyclase YcdT [Microbulbifer aggregans]
MTLLRHIWLPLLLVFLVVAQWQRWLALQLPLNVLLAAGLAAIAFTLGIFFKASRIATAALMTLLLLAGLHYLQWAPSERELRFWLSVGALNVALVSLTRDRSLLSFFGLILAALLAAQVAGIQFMLQECCGDLLATSWSPAVGLPLLDSLFGRLELADLLIISALATAAVAVFWHRDQVSIGLFGAGILVGVAYLGGPGMLLLVVSAIGLLLVLLALRTAYDLAFRDELTGIPSRRAYSRYLLTLGRNFSIAVVDIDHFKKLNDRHGHQVGDQALRMVAARIARYGGGRAFRYGGEEFVIVIRGKDRERAEKALERMREKIAAYPMRIRAVGRPKDGGGKVRKQRGQGGGRKIRATVSVGLAASGPKARTPDQVLEAADKALYRAKRGGRNRVISAA